MSMTVAAAVQSTMLPPTALSVASIILFTAAFSSVFTNKWTFTNFDDDVNFEMNTHIHTLSLENLRWMVADGTLIGVWEPVALFFKAAVFECFGVSAQAVAKANFFLHGANSLLTYRTTMSFVRLVGQQQQQQQQQQTMDVEAHKAWEWATFVATMAFAVHPLRAEVVGWCSAQPYLLGTLFSLLSVLSHLNHRSVVTAPKSISRSQSASWWRYLSVLCLVLAIWSKAAMISTAAIPFLVDVVLLWGNSKAPRSFSEHFRWLASILACHGPCLVVAGASVYAAVRASNHGDVPRLELDSSETLLRAPYALVFYIARAVLPRGLCPLYYLPRRLQLLDWRFGGPAIAALLCTLLSVGLLVGRAARLSRKTPSSTETLALAWLAYIAAVSPSLGLASSHVCMLAADRYCYTAAAFVGVPLVARFFSRPARMAMRERARAPARLLQVGTAALVLLLIVCTRQIVPSWRSSEELWSRIIRVNPYEFEEINASTAELHSGSGSMVRGGDKRVGLESSYYNLAVTVVAEGRVEYGVELYQKALEIRPDHVKSWGGLGSAFSRMGRYGEAVKAFETAIEMSPKNSHFRYNLGVVLMESGQLALAADSYKMASRLNSRDVKARNNLGNVLRVMGDLRGAESASRQVLALEPRHQRAARNLKQVLRQLGPMELELEK